jgi:hypothetical protein
MAADAPYVRSVRMRLALKMVTLVIMTVTTIVGARSCSGPSPNSPLDPGNLEKNGLGGLCANQNAVAQAAGDDVTQTLALPATDSNLGRLPGLAGLDPTGTFSCTTTTTSAGG